MVETVQTKTGALRPMTNLDAIMHMGAALDEVMRQYTDRKTNVEGLRATIALQADKLQQVRPDVAAAVKTLTTIFTNACDVARSTYGIDNAVDLDRAFEKQSQVLGTVIISMRDQVFDHAPEENRLLHAGVVRVISALKARQP